jgi:uncharacterized protein with PIN domain
MESSADFCFYNSLNDLLPDCNKNKPIHYQFKGKPAIKDAIEAIGIPHTEVDEIKVNGSFVDFSYPIRNGDNVEVFPLADISHLTAHSLTQAPVYPLRFIADVNVGKLAKALRMVGVDVLFQNNFTDDSLATIAGKEDRVVLTRDVGLLKYREIKWGYWLRSQRTTAQLKEVLTHFDLTSAISPFTRCINCNGIIAGVEKEKILSQLPPKTIQFFNEFYQCQSCGKVYWKGSHYQNMWEKIGKLNDKSDW